MVHLRTAGDGLFGGQLAEPTVGEVDVVRKDRGAELALAVFQRGTELLAIRRLGVRTNLGEQVGLLFFCVVFDVRRCSQSPTNANCRRRFAMSRLDAARRTGSTTKRPTRSRWVTALVATALRVDAPNG